MSDTIQGAKSRSYIKNDPIPGIENCQDSLEYNTVQELSGNRGGIDAVIHGSYTVSTGHSVEAGSVKRLIKSTAHGAKKGWIMRPTTSRDEIAIVKIVDANTFVISDFFPDISIADTFDICRFVTPNYTESGDLNVVVSGSGPIQYLKDAVITTVEEDTVTPADSNVLPTKIFGEGFFAGVTLNAELKTFDANAVTELGEINTEVTQMNAKTPALVAGNVPVDTGLVQGLTDAQLRATPVPVAGTTKETAKTGSFDEKLAFTTIQTFVAPAGAISANIMNTGVGVSGTANVRYKQGALATSTSGLRLEPGRSEMVMNGSNISIIPELGAVDPCEVAIIWNIQP